MKNNRRQLEEQPQIIQKDPTFNQHQEQFNPNNNRVDRNPCARVAKPRFLRKSELGQSNSEPGCSNLDVVDELGHGEVVVKLKDDDELVLCEDVDGVARRLEQMELRGEEADLSEDQLNLNVQLQEDELLAMKSIFGGNALILDRQRGLQSIQVHIYIETPDEISISTNVGSCNNSSPVHYLPPIVLTCVLPKSYPSHLPPYFTISAKWLNSDKISRFCSILDSIWNEQQGQEVMYQWVEWLQSSSVSYLEKEITLGPYGVRRVSPDVTDCPRCETACIADEDQHVQCPKCFFSFCGLCKEKRHLGIRCVTPEDKLQMLQERLYSSQLKGVQNNKVGGMINQRCNGNGEWDERKNDRQVFTQVQTELNANHGQRCPNCRQFNGKVGNNNHLFCWACQSRYCYLCKQVVRRVAQHFGPKGCKQHSAD